MPAFTFEKISSAPRDPSQPSNKPVNTKQAAVVRSRGLISDMLERLAASRLQRQTQKVSVVIPHKRPPPD